MKLPVLPVMLTAAMCLPAWASNDVKKGEFEFKTFEIPGTPVGLEKLGVERINDQFTSIGYVEAAPYFGFLRKEDGKVIDLNDPLSTGASQYTLANGANNLGTVVGYFWDTANSQYSAFFYRDGKFETYNFPGLPQYSDTLVTGINDFGSYCGYYEAAPSYAGVPFVNLGGKIITDFAIPGATFIEPESVNDFDQVAGVWVDSAGLDHGFLRDRDGKITEIDVPGAASPGTAVLGVNIFGWVSGHFFDTESHEHGFVRSPKGDYYQIDVPGAATDLALGGTAGGGLNDQGAVAGHYDPKDGGAEREYIATPKFPIR
jgi:probable HAF family extracellular repeat protein